MNEKIVLKQATSTHLWCKTLTLSLLCAFLFSCTTVNSRIDEKQTLFNTYPHEVQAQIQAQNIDYGMTEEMVYMAKGSPSDKQTFYQGKKKITVWKYNKSGVIPTQSAANTGFSGAYGYPEPGKPVTSHPMSYSQSYLSVTFEDGKLKTYQYLDQSTK